MRSIEQSTQRFDMVYLPGIPARTAMRFLRDAAYAIPSILVKNCTAAVIE
jgi:hypothetical protein